MSHIILYPFHHSVLVFQVVLKASAKISNQQQTQQPPDLHTVKVSFLARIKWI